jgi:hypothetical protein
MNNFQQMSLMWAARAAERRAMVAQAPDLCVGLSWRELHRQDACATAIPPTAFVNDIIPLKCAFKLISLFHFCHTAISQCKTG